MKVNLPVAGVGRQAVPNRPLPRRDRVGIATYYRLAFINIVGFKREKLLGSSDTIAEVGVAEGLLHTAEELRLLLRHLEGSETSLVSTHVD